MTDYVDYCFKCKAITPCITKEHPDGTEFLCQVCGQRVDFDFNEDVFDEDAKD